MSSIKILLKSLSGQLECWHLNISIEFHLLKALKSFTNVDSFVELRPHGVTQAAVSSYIVNDNWI